MNNQEMLKNFNSHQDAHKYTMTLQYSGFAEQITPKRQSTPHHEQPKKDVLRRLYQQKKEAVSPQFSYLNTDTHREPEHPRSVLIPQDEVSSFRETNRSGQVLDLRPVTADAYQCDPHRSTYLTNPKDSLLSQNSGYPERRCNTASDFRRSIRQEGSPKLEKEMIHYLVRKQAATTANSQLVSNNHRYEKPQVIEATEVTQHDTSQTQREKPNLVLQALTENDSVTSP